MQPHAAIVMLFSVVATIVVVIVVVIVVIQVDELCRLHDQISSI